MPCRIIKAAAILLAYALIAWTSSSLLALADGPPRFAISVAPQAEYAVAGQTFTYTVVITNVSQVAVKDVIVFMKSPAGTTFADTPHTDVNWLVGRPGPGGTGEVAWVSREPVAPDEVVTFELVVNVLPEMANQRLVNKEYGMIPMGGGAVIASGPPIETQVLATMPTATPVPSPTATATVPPAPTATSTPASQTGPIVADTVTPASAASSQDLVSEIPSSAIVLAIVGLSVLVAVIGMTGFLKRK